MEEARNNMGELKFDVSKVSIVPIGSVRPNTWNPKVSNTEDYEKIREGIRLKGLLLPVVVRENDGYEIIDGEQRWTACNELGFKDVAIYNLGTVSDKEARELTIWFQQQVPFYEIELASLVKKMTEEYGKLDLPFTDEQIATYIKMDEFSFDEYNKELEESAEKKKEVTCPECGKTFEV